MVKDMLMAKTGNDSNKWLPLYIHLSDTGGTMRYLIDEFVSDSIYQSCGLKKEDFKKIAIFLSYIHDIGKATIGFQYMIGKKLPERVSALNHSNLQIPNYMDLEDVKKTPHSIAGEAILLFFGCPEGIATVIGAHHGIPVEKHTIRENELNAEPRDIVGYENYYGENSRESIEEIWQTFIENALEKSGYSALKELSKINTNAQMILCALLIVADWIASNTEYFPLIDIEDTGEEICIESRVDFAWEKISFPEMWKSLRSEYSKEDFEKVFGFMPRVIQKEFLDIVEKSKSAGLYILEAPPGCGKTEAGLACSEVLVPKCGKNGLFFGLPTQATANAIFPRIMDWAEKQSGEFYHSIQLKHGNADLNDVFAKIQRGIPNEPNDSGLIVHSWFCGKKACFADFVIATVDQMLMMALKSCHVMLLHLGLSEKVVIIDEVHAYDSYMNQYLERALHWLGSYKVPVILLSATLPAARRMALVRAYLGIKKSDGKFEENEAYPLITWTDNGEIYQKELAKEGEPKKIRIEKCKNDRVCDLVKHIVESGGCVGIVCNTVKRAQKMADMVRLITKNVLLCHAQFIMSDRAEKEAELLEKIGKNSTLETRRGLVVVGTQVLEQSLDIDFDLLITDICPMDLLLQRIGRLHRHDRLCRPDSLKEPLCYVLTDEYDEEKSGSKLIYGDWLLMKTIEYIPETITLPDDISPLVQRVYSAADESDEYKKHQTHIKELENKAKAFLLDRSDDTIDDTIHGLLSRTVNDNCAEASVRGGISSIEVIVMQMKSDNTICFMDGSELAVDLTEEECRRIAEQRLRLPSRFSHYRNIDKTIKEIEDKCKKYIVNWQNSYLLKDKLVLFFDENYEAELMDCKLKYNYENGLICQKEGEKIE